MNRGVAVVTGASRGIGAGVAEGLAAAGCDVVLTARESRAARRTVDGVRQAAVEGARVEWIPADLSSMDEVVRLAAAVEDSLGRPSLLVHCAAVVPDRDTRTVDGFETQWAVNHLAPFLLTALLAPEPGPGATPGRVVTVASKLHRHGRIAPSPTLFLEGPYDREGRYCATKLANVLFARALARRTDPAHHVSLSLHPGAAGTGLYHDLLGTGPLDRAVNRALRTVRNAEPWGLADCVRRVLDVCLGPLAPRDHGSYREDGEISEPSPAARDDGVGEALWAFSEEALARWSA